MKGKLGKSLTAACLSLGFAGPSRGQGQEFKRLTIERLYSLPRLIGTAPKGFSWSPDSKRLAFLWNNEAQELHLPCERDAA